MEAQQLSRNLSPIKEVLSITQVSSILWLVQHNWQLGFVGLNIFYMLEGTSVGPTAVAMNTVPFLLSKHLFR